MFSNSYLFFGNLPPNLHKNNYTLKKNVSHFDAVDAEGMRNTFFEIGTHSFEALKIPCVFYILILYVRLKPIHAKRQIPFQLTTNYI